MKICVDHNICLPKDTLKKKNGYYNNENEYIPYWKPISYDSLKQCCKDNIEKILEEQKDKKRKLEENIEDNTFILKRKRDINKVDTTIKRIKSIIPTQ